jgi:putative membrane protein
MAPGERPEAQQGKATDYLANERTFLAWVRTGLTIIALGFVVVKFGLLIHELRGGTQGDSRLSAPIGIVLVGLGGALVLLALLRSRQAERDITAGTYRPDPLLTTALALGTALVAVLLAAYLAASS